MRFMEFSRASMIAHARHPIAAPVPADRLAELVGRCPSGGTGVAVDLGCGAGEWLLGWLERWPAGRGLGVDLSGSALDQAAVSAAARELGDRVRWLEADASTWRDEPVDVAFCVGSTHAFGGLAPTLIRLAEMLPPGGRALLGDGFWERPPSETTLRVLDATPDELPSLAGLLATCELHGFGVTFAYVSSRGDWQDYEFSWVGSLTEWALTTAEEPEKSEALLMAQEHRGDWLNGYRDELGFVTVALVRR